MTTLRRVEVMCETCGRPFITLVHPSICTWLDPSLVQEIYDEGYIVKCEYCNSKNLLEFKVLINARQGMFTLDLRQDREKIRKILRDYKIIDDEGKALPFGAQAKSKGRSESESRQGGSLIDDLREILGGPPRRQKSDAKDAIDSFHYKGVELLVLGRLEEAEQAFLKALEENAENVGVMLDLGIIYQRREQLSLAEDIFRKATELEPQNQQAWYKLGLVLAHQKKFQEAVQAFKSVIELMPDFSGAWEDYGYCLRKIDDVTGAEAALRKAIALNPAPISMYYLADIYYEQEKFTEAEELLNRVFENEPDFKDAWLLLGKVLEKLGREDEAKHAKEKAKMTEESS